MNTAREYRMPLLVGAGGVGGSTHRLRRPGGASELEALEPAEPGDPAPDTADRSCQAKLAALKTEKQNLTKSCADLVKIATQIPSVQSPTDVDAEESSFESQFNGLAETSGVTLTQFSGFAPDLTASAAAPPTTGTSTTASPSSVVAVPTTLTVTGDYAKMTSFINGLDNFPRLFVIQNFTLASGPGRQLGAQVRVSGAARVVRLATVGRRNPDLTDGRTLQPVHQGLDLLHLHAERPGRLHQGQDVGPLTDD